MLRRQWTATEITHDGRYYPMQDVKIHPAPMQAGGPPIVVAGRKEPAMRRAALLGDGWFPYMFSPRRYAESVATITLAASAAGRDLAGFHWCVWVFLNINPDGDVAREEAAPATSCSCPPPAARTTNLYSTSSSTRSCRRSATTQQVPKVGPAERSRRGRSPREWTLGRSRSDGKSTLSLKYSDVSIPDDLKAFVDETCRPLGEPGSLRLSHELGAGFIVMADPEASWRSDRPTTRWPPRRARRPAPLRPKSADGGTDGACAAPAS